MQSLPAKEPDSLQLSRGGTDGCQLSFRGLPCPDIGTGGHGYHGPYEHISVQSMDKVVDMMIELVKIYSTFSV